MNRATIEAWLNAVNPASRPAEQKAFVSAFGREDDALLADAVREFLSNPDRRGRPSIADLQRTLARLRGAAASANTEATDERLVHGGVPERMGFAYDSLSKRKEVPLNVLANWFREYADLLLDRCLWAHARQSADPVVCRMRERFTVLEASLQATGWVRRLDVIEEWDQRRGPISRARDEGKFILGKGPLADALKDAMKPEAPQ